MFELVRRLIPRHQYGGLSVFFGFKSYTLKPRTAEPEVLIPTAKPLWSSTMHIVPIIAQTRRIYP